MRRRKLTLFVITAVIIVALCMGIVGCNKQLRVTFNLNGGENGPQTVKVNNGEAIAKPQAEPTKDGLTFYFWADAEGKEFDFNSIISKNVTLYAVYKATVSFSAGGGQGAPDDIVVKEGEKVSAPQSVPTKANLSFYYWADSYGNEFSFSDAVIIKDITLTAVYKATVSFVADGGQGAPDDIFVKEGCVIDEPNTIPLKENYIFLYWALGGDEFDWATPIVANLVLTAVWSYVGPLEIESIEIGKMPDKLTYVVGETLDLTGGTLILNFTNGSHSEINLTSDDPLLSFNYYFAVVKADVPVVVHYDTLITTFYVQVVHPDVEIDWEYLEYLISFSNVCYWEYEDMLFLHCYFEMIDFVENVYATGSFNDIGYYEGYFMEGYLQALDYFEYSLWHEAYAEEEFVSFMRFFCASSYQWRFYYFDYYHPGNAQYNFDIAYIIQQYFALPYEWQCAPIATTMDFIYYFMPMTEEYYALYLSADELEIYNALEWSCWYYALYETYTTYYSRFVAKMELCFELYDNLTAKTNFDYYLGWLYDMYVEIYDNAYLVEPLGYDWEAFKHYVNGALDCIDFDNMRVTNPTLYLYFYYKINSEKEEIAANEDEIWAESCLYYIQVVYAQDLEEIWIYFTNRFETYMNNIATNPGDLEAAHKYTEMVYLWTYEMEFVYDYKYNEIVSEFIELFSNMTPNGIYWFTYAFYEMQIRNYYPTITGEYYAQWLSEGEVLAYKSLIIADYSYRAFLHTEEMKDLLNFRNYMRTCVERYDELQNSEAFDEIFGEMYLYYTDLLYQYYPQASAVTIAIFNAKRKNPIEAR